MAVDKQGRIVATHDSRGRERVQTVNDMPEKTIQSDYNNSEIHAVLKRFPGVSIQGHLAEVDAQFLDVTELPEDYRAVFQYTAMAEEKFMQLPSQLREVFDHNVAEWLDAAHDGLTDSHREQLINLGYMEAPIDRDWETAR